MAVKIKIRKRVHANEIHQLENQIIELKQNKKYYKSYYIDPIEFKYTPVEVNASLVLVIEASGLPINGKKEEFELSLNNNNFYKVSLDNDDHTLLNSIITNGKKVYEMDFRIRFTSGIPMPNTTIQIDLNPNSDNISLYIFLNP